MYVQYEQLKLKIGKLEDGKLEMEKLLYSDLFFWFIIGDEITQFTHADSLIS